MSKVVSRKKGNRCCDLVKTWTSILDIKTKLSLNSPREFSCNFFIITSISFSQFRLPLSFCICLDAFISHNQSARFFLRFLFHAFVCSRLGLHHNPY